MSGSNYPFDDDETITAAGQNDINDRELTLIGLNTIRMLQDRSIDFSSGQIDGWGEAYIDSNGRGNSVNTGSSTATFDTDKYKESSGTSTGSTIVHTIPSGTFPSDMSQAIGVPLIDDWEDGADIQFKLTNASEDTGWLDCGTSPTMTDFSSALTSEPTTLTVKLIPKASSPTSGYPSIKGFWIYGK